MLRAAVLLALGCVAALVVEIFPFRQDFAENKCGDDISSTSSAILNNTDVQSVFLIYEDLEDPCVHDIINSINYPLKLQLLHYNNAKSLMEPVIQTLVTNEDIAHMRRSLNILVICTVDCIRMSLEMSLELDKEFGKKSVLRHFSRWILVPTDHQSDIPVTNLTLDNVALLAENKKTFSVELSTLLWTESGREWSVLDNGCTDSLCLNDRVFPNIGLGLNGRLLIVSALEWLPFSKKERNSNKTLYSGISGDIMIHLSKRFNFSYQYAEPPDLLWGHPLENGSWTGIVGTLQREDADMSSVPYAYNVERAKVMSYTFPILMESSTVVYKKAEDKNKTWTVLISCFKWEVYAVGGSVIVVVTLIYVFLLSSTPNSTKPMDVMKKRRYIESFSLGMMGPLQQGSKTPPLFHSGQVLFGAWLLFCLIMTSIYKGNLMAFLTVDRLHVPFRTIQELASQDVYDVGAPVGSYLSLTIQNSGQPVMEALWKKIEKTHKSSPQTGDEDYEYQLRRLYEGQFAYIQSTVAADVFMSETCDLARINQYFLPTTSSMVFPLHSPLSRLFSPEVLTILETGLYRKWYEKWVPRPKACTDDSIAVGVSQLHIQEYYSALAACGVGIGLASIVLLLETYMHEFIPMIFSKT